MGGTLQLLPDSPDATGDTGNGGGDRARVEGLRVDRVADGSDDTRAQETGAGGRLQVQTEEELMTDTKPIPILVRHDY